MMLSSVVSRGSRAILRGAAQGTILRASPALHSSELFFSLFVPLIVLQMVLTEVFDP